MNHEILKIYYQRTFKNKRLNFVWCESLDCFHPGRLLGEAILLMAGGIGRGLWGTGTDGTVPLPVDTGGGSGWNKTYVLRLPPEFL